MAYRSRRRRSYGRRPTGKYRTRRRSSSRRVAPLRIGYRF